MPLAAGKRFAEIAGRKKRGQQQKTNAIFWPPAQAGINAVSGAAEVAPGEALILANMVPNQYGVHVRKGYRQHCLPIPAGDGIKTLIPFQDDNSNAPVNYLFAATSDGIYDVTAPGGTPTKVLDFPVKDDKAGWCSWHHYTTVAGQFVLLCDQTNGYYVYTASTNTWAQGSVSSGPTGGAAAMDFVTVWKNRVWFVEGSSGTAWYLPVGSINGNLAKFEFGNKFKYGGYLKSLWNWTIDGGEGVDDYLVAISSAGDMVVYKGTDPAQAATFNMIGWWYIGKVTQGRRQGDDMGGELLLLSTFGVIQTSKIISGLPATDEGVSISWKINSRINAVLNRGNTVYGWQMVFNPAEQIIVVITPPEVGRPWMQFVYSLTTRAWSQFYGVPMKTAEMFGGKMFFGDNDNIVWTYEGYADNVTLVDPENNATAVEWECLTSFQNLGSPAQFKRAQFLRPQFIGQARPSYTILARYDFDLTAPPGSPAYVSPTGGLWNTGIWDSDQWGGGYIVDQPPFGATGLGRHVAYYLRGRSAAETIHVGTDLMFDTGGLL
jgi:hypothetical protein